MNQLEATKMALEVNKMAEFEWVLRERGKLPPEAEKELEWRRKQSWDLPREFHSNPIPIWRPAALRYPAKWAFQAAAEYGRLDVLAWLYRTIGATDLGITDKDNRARDNYAFRWGAYCGHLDLLIFVHENGLLTDKDVKADNNCAFRFAAQNGRLNVLKWLYETFDMTREDARVDNNYAFRLAAEKGHLDVLKWLHDRFEFTAEDSRSDDNYAFRWASNKGHLDVLQWLHDTFGLTAEDARSDDNFAFRHASANGHLDVLKWMHDRFEFTAEDAKAHNDYAFRWASEAGHMHVCHWICSTFGLDIKRIAIVFKDRVFKDRELRPLICFFKNVEYDIKEFVLWVLYALLLFSVPVLILAFAFGIRYFLLSALLFATAWVTGKYLMIRKG